MFSNKINIKKAKLDTGGSANASFNTISPATSRRSASRSRSLTPPVHSPPHLNQHMQVERQTASSVLSEEDELYNNSRFTIYKSKLNIITQVLLQDLDKFERTLKEYKLSYDSNWSLFLLATINQLFVYINTNYESKPTLITYEPTEQPPLSLPLPILPAIESLIVTCTQRGLLKVFSLKDVNKTNNFGYTKYALKKDLDLLDGELIKEVAQLKNMELVAISNFRLISVNINIIGNALEVGYNLFNDNIIEYSLGPYNSNNDCTPILLKTSNELVFGQLPNNNFIINLRDNSYLNLILSKLNLSNCDSNKLKIERLKVIGDNQFILLFSMQVECNTNLGRNGNRNSSDEDDDEDDDFQQGLADSMEDDLNSNNSPMVKLGIAHFYSNLKDFKLTSASFITNSERVMNSINSANGYKLELELMNKELAVIVINESIVILKEVNQDTIGYRPTKYEKWLSYEILPLSIQPPHPLKLLAQTQLNNFTLLTLNYFGKLEFYLNPKSLQSSLNFNFEIEAVKFEYLKNLVQVYFKEINNYQSPIDFLKLINLQNFKIDLIESVILKIGEELFKGESPICLKTLNYQDHLIHRNFIFLEILKIFGKNKIERFSTESKSQLINWLDLIVGSFSLVKYLNPNLKLFPKSFPSKFLLTCIEKVFKSNNFENPSIREFFTHKIDLILDLIQEFINCYSVEFNSNGSTINSAVLELNQIVLVGLLGVETFRGEWNDFFGLINNCGSWTQDDKLYDILIAQFDYSLKEYRRTRPSEDMMEDDELNWSTVSIHSLSSQIELQKSLLSQLGDLGRFTLDIYHHLSTRGEVSQKKVKLSQLQDIKHRVCQPLVQLGYYDLVKAFSENLPDYKLLIDLILQCEPNPDEVLESYVDKFGSQFSIELYTIYVTTGHFAKIFTQPQRHSNYVNKFLNNSDYEKHLWIFKLSTGEPYEAYKLLRSQAQLTTCAKNKAILLRLAKYNYLEASATNKIMGRSSIHDPMDFEHDEDLDVLEDQIDLVNLINNIVKDQLSQYKGGFNQVLDTQLIQEMPCQLKLIDKSIQSIMDDQYLPPEDLIDLLMYMVPDKKELEGEHTNNGGNQALEAYRRFSNCSEDELDYMKRTIWRRLILKDDWSKIYQDSNRGGSDVLKDKLKSTHLYQAFNWIIEKKFPTNIKIPVDKVLFNTSKTHLEKRFENNKQVTAGFLDDLIKEYEIENSKLTDWLKNSELIELTNECWSLSETREYLIEDLNQLRTRESVKMEY